MDPLLMRIHGWSFFGKVGGAKVILADGLCANMEKIICFNVDTKPSSSKFCIGA